MMGFAEYLADMGAENDPDAIADVLLEVASSVRGLGDSDNILFDTIAIVLESQAELLGECDKWGSIPKIAKKRYDMIRQMWWCYNEREAPIQLFFTVLDKQAIACSATYSPSDYPQGSVSVSVECLSDTRFTWGVYYSEDESMDREGEEASFDEAFYHLPALVTSPDEVEKIT